MFFGRDHLKDSVEPGFPYQFFNQLFLNSKLDFSMYGEFALGIKRKAFYVTQ